MRLRHTTHLVAIPKNHLVVPEYPQEEDAICAICRSPYSSEDLATLTIDEPRTVRLPNCRHTFGYACLKRLAQSAGASTAVLCPLCRTPWWYRRSEPRLFYSGAEGWAQRLQCDSNIARSILRGEHECEGLCMQIAVDAACWRYLFLFKLDAILQHPIPQPLLEDLQDQCEVSTLAEVIFDPRRDLP